MNAFIRVTLSQLITVAGALNKRYMQVSSVSDWLLSDNDSSLVRSSE